MENSAEKIPVHIFDWIQQYRFEDLDSRQQQEVLQHMNRENYAEMHDAYRDIMDVAKSDRMPGTHSRKQILLDHFDKKYPQKKLISFNTSPLTLWKAAAVLLLCLSSGLAYSLLSPKRLNDMSLASRDTVYVTRQVTSAPKTIHDTVYLEGKTQPAGPKQRRDMRSATETIVQRTSRNGVPAMDVNILSVKEMGTIPNQTKHNSMKDDSIGGKYAFVSL